MYEFKVQGMSCGSCVNAITKAIKAEDPKGEVSVDLPSKTVKVESKRPLEELATLIEDLGYSVLEKRQLA